MSGKKPKPIKYNPQKTSSTSTYVLGGVAILVIAALVGGGVWFQANKNKSRNEGYGGIQNAAVETSVRDDGSILIGLPDAPTTVDIFEDPMCPYCAQLEATHGEELAQGIDEGRFAVNYHIMGFLDRLSPSGDYSTRGIAASQCVAETGDAKATWAFHEEMFAQQPKEGGSEDHSDEQLADMARDAGASDEAVRCITDGSSRDRATAAAQAASEALTALGQSGTPTVAHNGAVVDTRSSTWVAELK